MKKVALLSAAVLACFGLCSANFVSAQQVTANSGAVWFVTLVNAHNGKEFCAPASTTFNQLAAAVSNFTKKDTITDSLVIDALAKSYPCTRSTATAGSTESLKRFGGPNGSIRQIAPIFSQLLLLSVPDTFRPVFENVGNGGTFYIVESVPSGESTNQWTQMITRTGAKDLATRASLSPQALAVNLAGRFKSACPTSFNVLKIGATSLDGHDAYALVASCGSVADGNGSHSESTLIVQIKGDRDYYGVQWAVRGPASSQPMALNAPAWTERFQALQPIRLCPIVPGESAPYPSCLH
jgi:hypothetical protein